MIAPSGQRYWGLNGAAGLLAHDADRGVLLQHRAPWSHQGGTWGLPGGARHMGESAMAGALRECAEEAAVPRASLRTKATYVLDLDVWSYTTVVADVVTPFEAEIADAESLALEWVPVAEVDQRELHPGFAAAWPSLLGLAVARPVLVVDAANVLGARPDGWWRDRGEATSRLVGRIDSLAEAGLAGAELGIEAHAVMPRVIAVVEGEARGVPSAGRVEIVEAGRDGDSEVVAQARSLADGGADVTVVTSDRGLRARLPDSVRMRGAGWLRDLTDGRAPTGDGFTDA